MIHLIDPPDTGFVHLAIPTDAAANEWRFLATADVKYRVCLEVAAELSKAGIRSADWLDVVRAGIAARKGGG